MKSFYLRFFFVSSLALLAVGCGKEKGGKSAAAAAPAYYPLNTTLSQEGAEAMTSLAQWLTAAESSQYAAGLYKTNSVSGGFNLNGFICFSNCLAKQYPSCFVKGPNGNYSLGTTTSSSGIPSCTNLVEKPKASNTTLANAISGQGSSLVSAVRQGNVYTVTWRPLGSFTNTVHVIDTSMPAAINPVATQANNQSTYVEIRIL